MSTRRQLLGKTSALVWCMCVRCPDRFRLGKEGYPFGGTCMSFFEDGGSNSCIVGTESMAFLHGWSHRLLRSQVDTFTSVR